MVELAKRDASASNTTVTNIAERLINISQEVDKIEVKNGKMHLVSEAEQTGEFVLSP